VYYYRQAGHSVPAPHFYLEALRSRLTAPHLLPSLRSLEVVRVDRRVGEAVADFRLKFVVRNEGSIAAYKWNVVVDAVAGVKGSDELSRPHRGISVGDPTILPSLAFVHDEWVLRVTLPVRELTVENVKGALRNALGGGSVTYRAVSEVSRGENCHTELADVLDFDQLALAICKSLG
jgi:hypothetical protein